MKLNFLGGADEIGASATLISNGGRRVLVDCGIRMGAREALPHLAAIGSLDAIVITHAHLDHTGALPVIHAAFPEVPIYATAPTAAILRVMLTDALHLMESKAESEGEVPLYGPEAVRSLLGRLQKVPLLDPIPLDGDRLKAQFFPAGHILGAASIGLTGPEGKVLVSGDFAVSDQLTVPGMLAPRFEPDVAIVESTYGDRLHASREAEERRLVALVAETTAAGGKVLIPAFALGRAQEVLLILKRAMARKELPPIPVYADGMVKSICEVYRDFPEHLHVPLRRQMAKTHPFFPENGTIRKVSGPTERQAVLEGPPCVVVASSGMLTGGASLQYAKAMVGDRRNLIALTGYQDEESPGRALLDLADGLSRELRLGGQLVQVEARVAKVGLSAHADRSEIVGLLAKLRPGRVVLVHGEKEARVGLARALGHLDEDQIHLPELGEELDLAPRSRRERPPIRGIGRGAPLDGAAMQRLAEHVRMRPRLSTPRDLVLLWQGGREAAAEALETMERLLGQTPDFEPDRRRPFLYRPADPAELAKAAGPAGPMDMQRAFEAVDRLLPPETGLYRRGLLPEEGALLLSFHFPDVARKRQAEAIAAVSAETGYAVRLKPEPHMGELAARATALVPSEQAPSIRLETREVVLKVDPHARLGPEDLNAFRELTGFGLVLEARSPGPVAPERFDAQGRMEINAALAKVEARFRGLAHAPRKKSKRVEADGPYLELAFVSRAVAERYREVCSELELATGWNIRLASSADQAAILSAVQALVPQEWGLVKASLNLAAETATARISRTPEPERLEAIARELFERTGFRLEATGAEQQHRASQRP